jgi:tetratricopeptide (TPR) repeat protein
MKPTIRHGIDRRGLSEEFKRLEGEKSRLILEAHLFRKSGQVAKAHRNFAQAAEIEEILVDEARQKSLTGELRVHVISAASCWAQVGDYLRAIHLLEDLLATDPDMPPRLQREVQDFIREWHRRHRQRALADAHAVVAKGQDRYAQVAYKQALAAALASPEVRRSLFSRRWHLDIEGQLSHEGAMVLQWLPSLQDGPRGVDAFPLPLHVMKDVAIALCRGG